VVFLKQKSKKNRDRYLVINFSLLISFALITLAISSNIQAIELKRYLLLIKENMNLMINGIDKSF